MPRKRKNKSKLFNVGNRMTSFNVGIEGELAIRTMNKHAEITGTKRPNLSAIVRLALFEAARPAGFKTLEESQDIDARLAPIQCGVCRTMDTEVSIIDIHRSDADMVKCYECGARMTRGTHITVFERADITLKARKAERETW